MPYGWSGTRAGSHATGPGPGSGFSTPGVSCAIRVGVPYSGMRYRFCSARRVSDLSRSTSASSMRSRSVVIAGRIVSSWLWVMAGEGPVPHQAVHVSRVEPDTSFVRVRIAPE